MTVKSSTPVIGVPAPASLSGSTLLLLILPPLFWAGNAVAGRMAAGHVGPLELNCLRWIGAALMLLPFAWRDLFRYRREIRAHWAALGALAVFGVGCFNSFQYWALTTSSPINTSLIGSAGPVFILAIGAAFFGERVRSIQVAGALMSMAGVVWVMLRGDPGRLARVEFDPGDWFMLAATLTWSIYTWLLRKHRPALPLNTLLLMQILLGLCILVPLALLEAHYRPVPIVWNGSTSGLLLYISVFPSLAAYFCYDRAVIRVGAQLPVFFNNLTPVFAAMISMMLLNDNPEWFHAVGLVLILAGIQLVSSTRLRPGSR